ncbi:MAG: MAPEG family protein [Planctomycetes bacterium]|nr:MAPEG family protein [Planctomycetota bacterium]
MTTPLTALYAGLCAVLLLGLAGLVVRRRWQTQVALGDGDDPALRRAIAVHRNAVEYVPIALVLLLVAELNGAAPWLLHAAGATLVIARVLHAAGLSRHTGTSFGRLWGTVLTWLVLVVLALLDLSLALA